jgi:hypothetical protein
VVLPLTALADFARFIDGLNVAEERHCQLRMVERAEEVLREAKPKEDPQWLTEKIPAYYETKFEERFGIAVRHQFPSFGWVTHMQNVCFGGDDIPAWTVKNPYSVPAVQEFPDLPTDKAPSLAKPWTTRKIKQVDFQFVPLDKSYQWRYFCQLVELLQSRGNKVFVLVGPYNEHMMKGKAVDLYKNQIKPGMVSYLKEHNIPFLAPEPLPDRKQEKGIS